MWKQMAHRRDFHREKMTFNIKQRRFDGKRFETIISRLQRYGSASTGKRRKELPSTRKHARCVIPIVHLTKKQCHLEGGDARVGRAEPSTARASDFVNHSPGVCSKGGFDTTRTRAINKR
jgi:hypothetical protein